MEPIQWGYLLATILGIMFAVYALAFIKTLRDCLVDKRVNPKRWHYRLYQFSRSWIPNNKKLGDREIEDTCTYIRMIFGWSFILAFFLGSPKKQILGIGPGFIMSCATAVPLAMMNATAGMWVSAILGLELLIWYILKLKTSEMTRNITGVLATIFLLAIVVMSVGNLIMSIFADIQKSGFLEFLKGALIGGTFLVIAFVVISFIINLVFAAFESTGRALSPTWKAISQIKHRTICPFLQVPVEDK